MEPKTPPAKKPVSLFGCLSAIVGLMMIMVLVVAGGYQLWCARSARLVQDEFALFDDNYLFPLVLRTALWS